MLKMIAFAQIQVQPSGGGEGLKIGADHVVEILRGQGAIAGRRVQSEHQGREFPKHEPKSHIALATGTCIKIGRKTDTASVKVPTEDSGGVVSFAHRPAAPVRMPPKR